MDRETEKYVKSLPFKKLSALEISGSRWEKFGFASYRSVRYPKFDVCNATLDDCFDIIIAEQVLEHVLHPHRAVRNLYSMLNSGGVLVITAPFFIKVHSYPVDCSRWTQEGLKQLLIEGGFDPEKIKLGSWGNRACIVANFKRSAKWIPYMHSLKNEAEFPVTVWAFAEK